AAASVPGTVCGSIFTCTSSHESAHSSLEIVNRKICVLVVGLFSVLVGLFALANVAVAEEGPDIYVQVPVPDVGALPAIVADVTEIGRASCRERVIITACNTVMKRK